jgi:hypothetical protein
LFEDDAPAQGFRQAASRMGSIPQRDRKRRSPSWRVAAGGYDNRDERRPTQPPRKAIGTKLNGCSEFSRVLLGTLPLARSFHLVESEEDNMRTSAYVIAALAAITIAAPSIASADTVVIKHRDHWRGAHAEFRDHRDYGWHRGWWHRDHDRDRDRVIIREHRYRDRY